MDLAESIAVLYASETGNAEYISKHIHEEALARGYTSTYHSLDEHAKANFSGNNVLVIIASTTGDGDPPDNATKFWRWLRRGKPAELETMKEKRYTILGLGDTNYSNFCNTAKRIEKRLGDYGAKPFMAKGLADDATGMEAVVDPWLEKLWETLPGVVTFDEERAKAFAEKAATEEKVVLKIGGGSKDEKKNKAAAKEDGTGGKKEEAAPVVATSLEKASIPVQYLDVEVEGEGPDVSSLRDSLLDILKPTKLSDPLAYTSSNPTVARIASVRCLTGAKALKRVIEIEMDFEDLSWKYNPGDAFGVLCPNSDDLVLPLITRLGLSPRSHVNITPKSVESATGLPFIRDQPMTVYQLFRYFLDLHAFPKKSFIRMLAEHTASPDEKKVLYFLASAQGATAYRELRPQQATLLDILATFPSCQPPLARILENIPHLQPRFYSASSSPLQTPNRISFAFNIVEFCTPTPYNKPVAGLCTIWLDQLTGEATKPFEKVDLMAKNIVIPIYPKPVPAITAPFYLPEDPLKPIILISAGTGITPFISFLSHRNALIAEKTDPVQLGPAWMFHGRRFASADGDALYASEIDSYIKSGALTEYVACLSRDPPLPSATSQVHFKYVQDGIRAMGPKLRELCLAQDARIYVCGSVTMAKEVNTALAEIMGTSEDEGAVPDLKKGLELLQEWNTGGRYLKDIWT
ncbi:hypothetical protein DFS34DRAFT_579869 [Phlyctochytrium arcticum]|nr:hypothetical protein DFS34DRAFT_579869 [Phlyctochytrium arcticum]